MRKKRIEPHALDRIRVIDVTVEGLGVARTPEGQVVFIEGAIPGDLADLWVYAQQKGVLRARVEHILTPSPDRVQPVCQHFGTCGGCKWQHQSYAAQLRFKEKQVRDALERIAGIANPPVRPIIGAPQPLGYRNKLEFTFAPKQWLSAAQVAEAEQELSEVKAQPALGFHAPGAFDRVQHITECWLMDDEINQLRNRLYTKALAQGLSFHNPRTHEGFLRQVVFRRSEATGELLMLLVVYEDDAERVEQLLKAVCPEGKAPHHVAWMVNPKHNDSYSEMSWDVWRGTGVLREKLAGYTYDVSPVSFFQTNTQQAEQLYTVVLRYLQQVASDPVDMLYDLYCGAGTITLAASKFGKTVLGLEYNVAAVEDANRNAATYGLDYVYFKAGDIGRILNDELSILYGKPNVVITDPPRGGMDASVCERLLEIEPSTIIYVSCNPSTQARDIKLLAAKYKLLEVQPVDMFPQTSHIESVALLTL